MIPLGSIPLTGDAAPAGPWAIIALAVVVALLLFLARHFARR